MSKPETIEKKHVVLRGIDVFDRCFGCLLFEEVDQDKIDDDTYRYNKPQWWWWANRKRD